MSVHLVEASDALVAVQRATLCGDGSGDGEMRREGKTKSGGIRVVWHRGVETLPEQVSK